MLSAGSVASSRGDHLGCVWDVWCWEESFVAGCVRRFSPIRVPIVFVRRRFTVITYKLLHPYQGRDCRFRCKPLFICLPTVSIVDSLWLQTLIPLIGSWLLLSSQAPNYLNPDCFGRKIHCINAPVLESQLLFLSNAPIRILTILVTDSLFWLQEPVTKTVRTFVFGREVMIIKKIHDNEKYLWQSRPDKQLLS